MTHDELPDDVKSALAAQDFESFAEAVHRINAPDLADILEQSSDADFQIRILMALPLELRASTFGHLSLSSQQALARQMPATTLAEMFVEMHSDEQADLAKALEEPRRRELYRCLTREERENVRMLASYEEGSAGSIMTTDYTSIMTGMTVAEALQRIRLTAPDKETIYVVLVTDASLQLKGIISLRELIIADPRKKVDDLMNTEIIYCRVDEPQEEVARLIARYDVLALPILDSDNRLLGIVTHDDAMDVAEAEATADMHKSATVGKLEGSFAQTSYWSLYRSRVHWLVILVFANIFTGAGIAYFEDIISAHIALLFFMPLLVASAGNAGAQSATLMVRGLATGDVTAKDWGKLLLREVFVALGLGLTMAAAVMVVGMVRSGFDIALVVALTMILVVMVGSLIGMLLPFLLSKAGVDPATASTPLITTIADVSGVLIYFSIASVILGLTL